MKEFPMASHPALAPGHVAVVTGAASGIGLAAASRFAKLGLKVCLADLSAEALAKADPAGGATKLKSFDAFSTRIGDLSALDMKGHVTLKERGAVDDLKCILRGISQDLPEKLTAVGAAKTIKDQDLALRDMVYLLNDNVEVITAPPQPAA